MSDGLRVISAALSASSASALIAMPQDMFLDNERTVLDFVRTHYRQYRELPEARTVQEETGVRLPAANETLAFYVDRMYERHEYNQIRDRFAGLRDGLASMNMQAVAASVADMHRVTRQRVRRGLESVNLREASELVVQRLNATRGYGGVTGIETGWPGYDQITGGYQNGDLISLVGRPSLGKCMHPDTPVLMHSGQIRKIRHVKVGDRLMGPDSSPREVLSTTTGTEEMFRISPVRGEEWSCNGSHILVLRCGKNLDRTHTKGSTHLYSVNQFLSLPSRVQRSLRLVRTGVDFPHEETEFDPYIVGVWLGDGCVQNGRVSSVDKEIVDSLREYAKTLGMTLTQYEYREGFCPSYGIVGGKGKENALLDHFRSCLVGGEKRIPSRYLRNSRKVRLQMLAGLIDTDGYLIPGQCIYEILTKYTGLRDDILYLARSLGLGADYGVKEVGGSKYQRITITGHIEAVPVRLPRKKAGPNRMRKDALCSGFTITSLGVGEYFGVTLSGDHLYLLGDFTITHNTYLLLRQAWYAHVAGSSVLFVTTEMGAEQIGRRHVSIALGINPTHLKMNTVSTYTERRISQFYRDMIGVDRFRIFSVGMNSQLSAVEAFIQEFDPDLIVIDGVYLMRPNQGARNASRTERITAVFDELKALTLETNKPFLVSTQFNRAAGKGGAEGSLENIGYTDAIGTHSSVIVAARHGPTTNPKASRWLQFLKGREGEEGRVAINFKFAPLDMDEFTPVEAQDSDGTTGAVAANVNWMA